MIDEKYNNMLEKLDTLTEKHELIYRWDTASDDISLTVEPNAVSGEQTSFIEDNDGEKSSGDAKIKFIFRDGSIVINTTGKLFVSEALLNKLKNIAKKLHYLYLQKFRKDVHFMNENYPDDEDGSEDGEEYDREELDEPEDIEDGAI